MRVEQEYQTGRPEPAPTNVDTAILSNRMEKLVDALWDVQLIADPSAFFLLAPVKEIGVTVSAAGTTPVSTDSKLLLKNELQTPVMLEAWLEGNLGGNTAWLLLGSQPEEAVIAKSRNKSFGEAPRVKCIVPVGSEVWVNATSPSGAAGTQLVLYSVVAFRSRGSIFKDG